MNTQELPINQRVLRVIKRTQGKREEIIFVNVADFSIEELQEIVNTMNVFIYNSSMQRSNLINLLNNKNSEEDRSVNNYVN